MFYLYAANKWALEYGKQNLDRVVREIKKNSKSQREILTLFLWVVDRVSRSKLHKGIVKQYYYKKDLRDI